MSTKDLVAAIVSGNAIDIENTFASTVSEKISASLDTLRVDLAQNMFSESVNKYHYSATSEPNNSGGHRAKVVHKKKGTMLYLGQHSYPTPEAAKSGAQAYVDAYEKSGDRAASRAAHDHAKQYMTEVNVNEGLADDFLAVAKSVNPNAKARSSATDAKAEREKMLAKRAADTKGSQRPAPGYPDRYPLGGYDPKSHRSYNEEVEDLNELKKSTLASYISRASKSAADLATSAMHHKNTSNKWDDIADERASSSRPDYKDAENLSSKYAKHSLDATNKSTKRIKGVDSALWKMMQKEEVDLDEGVSSSSKKHYEFANDSKPSGHGNWMFSTVEPREHDVTKHKDQTVQIRGTFSDASKQAAQHFKSKGHRGEIHVLS